MSDRMESEFVENTLNIVVESPFIQAITSKRRQSQSPHTFPLTLP